MRYPQLYYSHVIFQQNEYFIQNSFITEIMRYTA